MEALALKNLSTTQSYTNINKSILVDSFILLLIQFFGALLKLEILSLVAAGLYSLIVAFKYRKGWYGVALIGITLLVFQNFVIGLGAHIGRNTSSNLSFLTQIATVFLFVNSLFILCTDRLNKILVYCLFIITIFALLFLISSAPFMSKLVYFRNFALAPMIVILCYKHLVFKDFHSNDFKKFLKFIIRLSVIVFIFGFIMYFAPYNVWKAFGIDEVYIAKGDTTITNGFNGRFLTNFVMGYSLSRMASFYFEPVNLGYFFVFALVASYLYWKYFNKKAYLPIAMNLLGLLLTFGKGAFLLLFSIISIMLLYWAVGTRKRRVSTITIPSMIIFLALFGALWIYYTRIGGAASPHFWGIEATSKSIMSNPLGYGLGSGGNFGENGMDFSAGAETGLLSMIYQIGIPVFILVLVLYFIVLKRAIDSGIKVICFIPLAILFVSLFQENTFTPQCLIPVLSICLISFQNKKGAKV